MVLATTGPRRVVGDTSSAAKNQNVGQLERWLSVLGGTALAVFGASRRGSRGTALGAAGAVLLHRGVTGHCYVYDALGVSSADEGLGTLPHRELPSSRAAVLQARHAIKIERSITVNRAPAECYAVWQDPTNLPRFMQYIVSVEPLSETSARWRMRLAGGKIIEWTALVINDVPNELIAWKSAPDAGIANAGSVHFREAPGGRGTEVTLIIEAEPPGHGAMPRSLARLLGRAPDAIAQEDLRRFKRFVETGDLLTTEGQASGRG